MPFMAHTLQVPGHGPRMNTVGKRTHRKTGCIPCKIRKKRCSEHKPTCTDCERLGFTCVYLPEKSTREEANQYRERVEKELLEKKLLLDKRNGGAAGAAQLARGTSGKASAGIRAKIQIPGAVKGNEMLSEVQREWTPASLQGALILPENESRDGPLVKNDLNADPSPLLDAAELLSIADGNGSLITGVLPFSMPPSPALPSPSITPPLSDPIFAQLDATALHLYSYYRDSLAPIVSIAPSQQNHYLRIFLPMAHQNEGVLYGILAWAARHLSLTVYETDTSLDASAASAPASAAPRTDPQYTALANKYTLLSLQRLSHPNDGFLMSLAQILVLCGAEICQGDVARWRILLRCATRMIKEQAPNGDIGQLLANSELASSLADTQTTRWLLSNFVYHDIMGSDKTHFPMDQYARVLQNPMNPLESPVDPLYGVNRPVFQVLGQVKNLARQIKQELRPDADALDTDNADVCSRDLSSSARRQPSREAMTLAQTLQGALYSMSPSESDLAWYQNFADIDGDTRLLAQTLFSVFRTAALLLLKTAVLKSSTDSFEIRHLVWQLAGDLDSVLGSRLEGGLCFPLFICGINAHDRAQRINVEIKFADFLKRYKFRNVERALVVMRQVWESADRGLTQDWFDIVDEIGWDLNFA